jgi:predicted NAD/FAD-binding protein
MKIAIVGAGVSGLVAAHLLHQHHAITVFEAAGHVGGHAQTTTVDRPEGRYALDTGFIVLNDRTYPTFSALLRNLLVPTQRTHMGFSVSSDFEDFEYAGTPQGLFAQRRNAVSPRFLRMVADLVRFNRAMRDLLTTDCTGPSVQEFLTANGYSSDFIDRLIVPQACAIWSSAPSQMWSFPIRFLAEFFGNHGLLSVRDRPRWETVCGGSRTYVDKLKAPFADHIHTSAPVAAIERYPTHVEVASRSSGRERFDAVVLACHADQALALLADPTACEAAVLSAFPYASNDAVLHTDARMLPKHPHVRQAWNYHLLREPRTRTTVTYSLNRLQQIDAPVEFCVTLNLSDRIAPDAVIDSFTYAHPVYTSAGRAAQARRTEISGCNRTYYCGAYWRWGFHEDGAWSAVEATRPLLEGELVAA